MKNDLLKENDLDNFLKEYQELCTKHGISLISESEPIHAISYRDRLPEWWENDKRGIKINTIDEDGLVGIASVTTVMLMDDGDPLKRKLEEIRKLALDRIHKGITYGNLATS